jgi:hypothetical protein
MLLPVTTHLQALHLGIAEMALKPHQTQSTTPTTPTPAPNPTKPSLADYKQRKTNVREASADLPVP